MKTGYMLPEIHFAKLKKYTTNRYRLCVIFSNIVILNNARILSNYQTYNQNQSFALNNIMQH